MRAVCRFGLLLLAMLCCAAVLAPGAGAADDRLASSGGAPREPWKPPPTSYLLVHVAPTGAELSRVRLRDVDGQNIPDFAVAAGGRSIWVYMVQGDLVHLDGCGEEVWRGSGFRSIVHLVANPNDGSCWTGFNEGALVHLSAKGKEICRRPDLSGWRPLAVNPADGSLWAWSDKGEVIHLTPSGRTLGRASLGGWTNDSASAAVNARDGSLWTVTAPPRRIIQLAGDGRVLARKAPLPQEVRVHSVNPRNGSYWGAVYWWTDEEGPHVGALANVRVVHLTADGQEVGSTEPPEPWMRLFASPFDDSCWKVSDGARLYHLDAKARIVGKPLPYSVSSVTVDASDGSCWAVCAFSGSELCEAAERGDADGVRAALAATVSPDVRDLQGRTPLHLAAQSGHTDVIQLLLDAGADVNAEDRDYGSRPLYYAVGGGHVPAARLLLCRGAAVDAINHTRDPVSAGSCEYFTALSKASEMGRTELVALLLDHGADAAGRGDGGWPLLLAMSRGHVEVMQMLLDHGADVNARDRRGATLLHLTGKPKLVELLLARGANASARDDEGVTPLQVAAVMAWLEATQMLLDAGADVNAKDSQGWTPLHYAALASRKAKYFCLDLTKMLLRYGADPGARDRDGNTPLHLGASGKTGLAAAALLLEARPDLEDRNNEGDTLLHVAAALGCTEWAFVLLEKGADPRAKNTRGETPLHLAARNDLCDLSERLLEAGADVNDQDTDGDTPLHLAAQGRVWTRYGDPAAPTLYRNVNPYGVIPPDDYGLRTETDQLVLRLYGWPTDRPPGATTECLLSRGADPNVRNKAGMTPLHCALTVALSEARSAGVTPRTTSTLRALVAAGASGDAADANGDTPVHLAARGLPGVLQMLLARGAKVDARDRAGDTPLHAAAAATGDVEVRGGSYNAHVAQQLPQDIAQCAKLLIQHGADVNASNNNSDTPLHVAVAVGGIPSVVQALLDGHADIDAFNSRGETPLQLAIREREKRDVLVELLRARGASRASAPAGH